MRIVFIVLIFLIKTETEAWGQSKSKSVPFLYYSNQATNQYDPRLRQKTLPDAMGNFACLTKKSGTEYEVMYFTADLKKLWQTTISLTSTADPEAFFRNDQSIWLLAHQKSSDNTQQELYAYEINLKTGQKRDPVSILATPAKTRRIGTAVSADGSKLLAYQYLYQQDQLKAITATIYDGNLTKIKDQTYSLQDLTGIQSATIQLDNAGNQYVALITNNATKLSVRRYTNTSPEVNGQDIQLGGVFAGKTIYILDSQFIVQPDGQVYAAAICADEKTGAYHSLKVVQFDFTAKDLLFAPEFRFTPQYLAELNKHLPAGTASLKKLEDISLTDIIISSHNNLVVIAEKKFNESPEQPYVAQELHLFAYDEYLKPTWHSVINKDQTASPTDAYAGISYKKHLFGNNLQLITLEKINGKTALLNRSIHLKDGVSSASQVLKLPIDGNQAANYLKDFTAWLDANTILTVTKSPRKPGTFQLSRVSYK